MAIYVEINGTRYPASITGQLHDKDWDNRTSKSITLEMPYEEVSKIFTDDIEWNIVQEIEEIEETKNEEGEAVTETKKAFEIYNNSEYCIAGDIIDHRNGAITVKMGKPTAAELLAMLEEVL